MAAELLLSLGRKNVFTLTENKQESRLHCPKGLRPEQGKARHKKAAITIYLGKSKNMTEEPGEKKSED